MKYTNNLKYTVIKQLNNLISVFSQELNAAREAYTSSSPNLDDKMEILLKNRGKLSLLIIHLECILNIYKNTTIELDEFKRNRAVKISEELLYSSRKRCITQFNSIDYDKAKILKCADEVVAYVKNILEIFAIDDDALKYQFSKANLRDDLYLQCKFDCDNIFTVPLNSNFRTLFDKHVVGNLSTLLGTDTEPEKRPQIEFTIVERDESKVDQK